MDPHYDNNAAGYQQGNPPPYGQGEAASYYAGAPQQPYQQFPPQGQPGYGQPPQQHHQYRRDSDGGFQQDGPDSERGVLGAIGGGVAGAVGGHKIGGKVGHSKLSSKSGFPLVCSLGHESRGG